MTDFSNICNILGELYDEYDEDENLAEFIHYNDLGLPLAYYVSNDLVILTPTAELYVTQTWEKLLEFFDIEDQDFTTIEEMIDVWQFEQEARLSR